MTMRMIIGKKRWIRKYERGIKMNIQIFGTKKSFDSKKAERFFKERGIKYQFVDMKEKGLSKGEFNSVCQAVGGYEKLIDQKHYSVLSYNSGYFAASAVENIVLIFSAAYRFEKQVFHSLDKIYHLTVFRILYNAFKNLISSIKILMIS